jgi:hypothetical protein
LATSNISKHTPKPRHGIGDHILTIGWMISLLLLKLILRAGIISDVSSVGTVHNIPVFCIIVFDVIISVIVVDFVIIFGT